MVNPNRQSFFVVDWEFQVPNAVTLVVLSRLYLEVEVMMQVQCFPILFLPFRAMPRVGGAMRNLQPPKILSLK